MAIFEWRYHLQTIILGIHVKFLGYTQINKGRTLKQTFSSPTQLSEVSFLDCTCIFITFPYFMVDECFRLSFGLLSIFPMLLPLV